jgi:hypothetical protein
MDGQCKSLMMLTNLSVLMQVSLNT